MNKIIGCFFVILLGSCISASSLATENTSNLSEDISTRTIEKEEGFFNFVWDEKKGTISLEIDKFDQEFLYVNALSAGVGSNDIGLDRGQLGNGRIVKFIKVGPKVLMVQPNYGFRAVSDNPAETESVEQAFAQSVIWGFKVEKDDGESVTVNATDFLLRDAHGVVGKLQQTNQGSYQLDKSRSAIYPPMCKNFPKNTELEATLTFTGKPKGRYIRSVTPSPEAVTVRMHHSLIALPDDNYEPRVFDPRCGYFGISYQDYATPIDQPLVKRFIRRHRLKKKNPSAAVSEAVEPIIYYVDRGAPEPIRSALITGASWWNQAFEAAGYKDAFQVKVMPDDADPMDVRYNVIQWVHRATRGWSYGSSVTDPRTGEIIKGHVSLGSLRVRQDFLLAQGLVKAYEEGKPVAPQMLEMSLARLRQLSAHEVGHTIGLAHNFAASTNDRASVMDYPHPYITLNPDGSLNFDDAYDDKIGAWDKRTVLYGYQDFPQGTNIVKALLNILEENRKMGLRYISDPDARPTGSAHPYAHLWDNGADPIAELNRLMEVRKVAMRNFGKHNIAPRAPMSTAEEVLVPLYLAHRYQVEAVAKMIGGVDYEYSVRGDVMGAAVRILDYRQQNEATAALLKTIHPEALVIPETILNLIPPKAYTYQRGRESFKTRTGLTLDPMAAAESVADHLIGLYLHPQRATRLIEQHARDSKNPGLHTHVNALLQASWYTTEKDAYLAEIGRVVDKLVLNHLFKLAMNRDGSDQVRAITYLKINELEDWLGKQTSIREVEKAHYQHALLMIQQFKNNPTEYKNTLPKKMPDGSPIGMDTCGHGSF
ncbi:MAG: zinc-dependent metalloprotease [Bacteroidota bacterium]